MGSVPISAAIAGSDVAMTVESICSMNRATANMSGVTRIKAGNPMNRRRPRMRPEPLWAAPPPAPSPKMRPCRSGLPVGHQPPAQLGIGRMQQELPVILAGRQLEGFLALFGAASARQHDIAH